jgi:hypothetical protein
LNDLRFYAAEVQKSGIVKHCRIAEIPRSLRSRGAEKTKLFFEESKTNVGKFYAGRDL